MNELFYTILEMSISASILVLVVLLLRLILRKAPKWVNVLLWALVAVRLICPFSIESPFSLMPNMDYLAVNEVVSYVDMGLESDIPEYVIGGNPIGEDEPTHTSPTDPVTQINRGFSVELILSFIWLSGVSVMLIYMIVSCICVYRRIQKSTQFRDNIYTSNAVTSPFVFGIVKPSIYLPESMDAVSMSYVIAHEEAHVRRRDHWWKPFGFILLAVHWFNPIIWLAYILLCRDIEMACDERVIREMGERERVDYSEALLDCSVSRRMITACPLAFGENNVKERIRTVLNYKKPAFWIVILAVIACAVAAICFLTNPKQNIEDSTLIPYNATVYHSEHISDDAHNRDINIIKLDTESAYNDTIFQAITQKFNAILNDYMSKVPYEHQYLAIDSAYCEIEDFLCISVIASLPSQYPIPFVTESIFWNRAEDKLYSIEDYLNIIGIDRTKVESSIDDTVNENFGALYKSTIDGMFYLNNNIYFIIQVESNFENGINATETMFYNYSSSELILCGNFSGFSDLKDESDTIESTDSVVIGVNDHISTPKPVLDYALNIVKESIAEYNELGISQKEITGTTYTITDARIDSIQLAEEAPGWLNENEYIYKMEFWLKPSETDETKIFLAGEMFLEHGWFKITNRCLLMKCEKSGDTEIWTPIGVIDAERLGESLDVAANIKEGFGPNRIKIKHINSNGQLVNVTLGINLPKEWTIKYDYQSYEMIPFAEYADIKNGSDCVGGIGFLTYDLPADQANIPEAIFNQIAMGAVTFWNIHQHYDLVTDESLPYRTALTSVLYSSKAFQDGKERSNSAIVSYHPEYKMYIALQLTDGTKDRTILSEEELRYVAESIEWIDVEFSDTGADAASQSELFKKTVDFLSQEFHDVYDPYYQILNLAIFDWKESGNEATFRYTVTHQYWNRDPDTVDYIKAAKDDPKRYEMMCKDYLVAKVSNFYFKVVLNGDEIELYSNESPTGIEWKPRKIADYLPKQSLPITITEVNRDSVMEHGTHEYIHEQSEYTRYFQISTRDKYTNIRITSMTLGETGMEVGDVHYTFPEFTSQKPLLIGVTFYGDMTTYGLLLTDTNGVEHQYMIYESGEDGSVVLQEY